MTSTELAYRAAPVTTLAPIAEAVEHAVEPKRLVRPWELVVLVGYGILLGSGVAHHEPWADEVQSWLLGRDASIATLFGHQLRYEGSPGLWQLLLLPFAKAGLPVVTLNIIGAVVAFAGVAMVLFASPLPALVRAVLPFTYYFAFQYAVVARSYNLFIPIVLGVAWCHRSRFERPLRYTALLCLLSGVAVEAMVVAGVLFALFLVQAGLEAGTAAAFWRRFTGSLALFAAVEGALVAVLWPTPDNESPLAHILVTSPTAVFDGARTVLDVAYVGVPWLNYVILLVACVWLYTRRALLFFLLPTVAALLFSAVKLYQLWFSGLLTVVLVAAVWVGLDNEARPLRGTRPAGEDPERVDRWWLAVVGALVVLSVVQIRWTALTYAWDAEHAYAPGPAAGRYLADLGLSGASVATLGDYWSVDLEPYLASGRFSNLDGQGAYYYWSRTRGPIGTPIEDGRADVVVTTLYGPGPDNGQAPRPVDGYHVAAVFPGQIFWHDAVSEHEDLVVYFHDGRAP